MKKTIKTIALSVLCAGALSAVNAAYSYTAPSEENLRTAQSLSASPLRLTSDKYALAFHKTGATGAGRGSISFFDKSDPGSKIDRYYVLAAYGVTTNTKLYYQNGQTPYYYGYGTYTSSTNVSGTRIYGFYDEEKSADTAKISFRAANIDTLIARAKKEGYYKIRFTVDSIGSKLPSHSAYGAIAGYENGKTKATYYMYYTLPATGTAYIKKRTGSVNTTYTASNAVTSISFPLSTDTISANIDMKGADSVKMSNEFRRYYYDASTGKYQAGSWYSAWDGTGSFSNNSYSDGVTVRKGYRIAYGDSLLLFRQKMITRIADSLGKAIYDTTYSNEIKFIPLYHFVTEVDPASPSNSGTISTSYNRNVNAGSRFSVVATPKTGFSFVGWYPNAGSTNVSTASSLSITVRGDTTLSAYFNVTPIQSRFWLASSKYNGGSLTSNSDTSKSTVDFVYGRDSLNFSNYMKGTTRSAKYVVQVSKDGATYSDIYTSSVFGYTTFVDGNTWTNNIKVNRKGQLIVGTTNMGSIKGNSYTNVRVKAVYSDSAKAADMTTSKIIRINWKSTVLCNGQYPDGQDRYWRARRQLYGNGRLSLGEYA